VVKHFAN